MTKSAALLKISEYRLRRVNAVPEQFMSVKQTAEYLNMSVAWVYREATGVGLVPYKFGSGRNAKLQFKVSEVQAWVKQQRVSGV
ncbi:helix-turn-helix transcriptional regulator [Kitasatospora sp. NPDC058965]|uniref:helix-turn-helix transcriptional regulator n=1 Tax=Kitasatospora sp. NPDC058965 TaxID=3346682 RepID=UPI003681BE22